MLLMTSVKVMYSFVVCKQIVYHCKKHRMVSVLVLLVFRYLNCGHNLTQPLRYSPPIDDYNYLISTEEYSLPVVSVIDQSSDLMMITRLFAQLLTNHRPTTGGFNLNRCLL
jgi:hypothetical protein